MTQEKREQIKANLTKITDFLKTSVQYSRQQRLVEALENVVISEEITDIELSIQTILEETTSQYLGNELTDQHLVKKIIKDCMRQLDLSIPAKPSEFVHEERIARDIVQFAMKRGETLSNLKATSTLFKTAVDIQTLLHAVIWSDAEKIVRNKTAMILRNNPELLFIKGDVIKEGIVTTDDRMLYKQSYYNISAFQWILFSGDMYLLAQIKPFITEANRNQAKRQSDELTGGGSDLVKLGVIKVGIRIKDMGELSYEELTQFVDKDMNVDLNIGADAHPNASQEDRNIHQMLIEVEQHLKKGMPWPLQENKDAIVLYNNDYYHVRLNHKTKEVENTAKISLKTPSTEEQEKLDALFTNMEMNSARRSNDREHTFIKTATKSALDRAGIHLERKGIRYKRGDDDYQDCKSESLVIRALRQYLRVWNELQALNNDDENDPNTIDDLTNKAEDAWLDVGKAQATDTTDTLLFYCMKNKGLYQTLVLKEKFDFAMHNIKREFEFQAYFSKNTKRPRNFGIYSPDWFIGIDFSLQKRLCSGQGAVAPDGAYDAKDTAVVDLTALHQYKELSRTEVNEFKKFLDFSIPNPAMKP